MNLIAIMRLTEDEARELIESIRWRDGMFCPLCGCVDKLYKLKKVSYYRCGDCKGDFTVRMGTVMHRSHLPSTVWLAALYMVCSHKKGISSKQISRDLGVSGKTAWFLLHRIRHAIATNQFTAPLSGVVEVDETYVGGKPPRGSSKGSRGYWSKKTPVVALVERDGNAKAFAMPVISGGKLKQAIRDNVAPDSTIMTDDANAYKGIGKEFKGGHKSVMHTIDEFVRGDAHINTAESFFSLLKRGIYGTFHSVSKEHLQRYVDEFTFRWNNSHLTDIEQLAAAIIQGEGKRLMYKEPKLAIA